MVHHRSTRKLAVITCAATLVLAQACSTKMNSFDHDLSDIRRLAEAGELAKADDKAAHLLANEKTLSPEQIRELEFERVRVERIRKDYSVTEEKLRDWLADEKRGIADYSDELFTQLEADGYFDFKYIDGEKRYIGASRPNLFFRHDEVRSVDFKPEPTKWEQFILEDVKRVSESFDANSVPPIESREFELTYTIKVKEGKVQPGEMIECWMPFPQEFAWQKDIELIQSSPAVHTIAPADYPMRSLYFQQEANGDGVAEFSATWRMSRTPQYTRIDPNLVPDTFSDPSVELFTKEQAPHVMFTDDLVALEKEIAGDLTNPAEKARAYYDWMQKNIKYSYAREYSTLQNISQFVCDSGYGDCGQIALMYITLCRIGGIPARWSTGWNIYPRYVGIHDWAEIYLEPYGWIHVDANWAIYVEREFFGFTAEEKKAMSDYYFGGIDAYRFTANRNHGIMLTPPKTDFRSDTVDFQRGELEANNRNLYYGDYTYKLDVKFLEGHPQSVYDYVKEKAAEEK